MTMRERIERALLGTGLAENISDQHLAPLMSEAVDAVLDAMREPTEAMMKAGIIVISPPAATLPSEVGTLIWERMIATAKEER